MNSSEKLKPINVSILPAFAEWHESGYYTVSGPISEDNILEMAKQIIRKRFGTIGGKLCSAKDAVDYIQSEIGYSSRMGVSVLFLSASHEVIVFERMFEGTIDSCVVHRREIFKRAFELDAKNLIIASNRPSGDISSSKEDMATVKALKLAADHCEIKILDYIFVSGIKVFCMSDNGNL